MAILLRQRKATRRVPTVFAGGRPEAVARVRGLLPDAVFTRWGQVRGSLRQAIRRPPGAPVVPGTMDPYAGRPLLRKLGIRTGSIVVLLGAPATFEKMLGPLPEGVQLRRQARGGADVVVLFARSAADLGRRLPAAVRALARGGGLWIAWPKKTSGVASDLSMRTVQTCGLGAGLVDCKVCRIDETWSGLRFTRRRRRDRCRS